MPISCVLRSEQPGHLNVRAVLRHFVPNKGLHPLRCLRHQSRRDFQRKRSADADSHPKICCPYAAKQQEEAVSPWSEAAPFLYKLWWFWSEGRNQVHDGNENGLLSQNEMSRRSFCHFGSQFHARIIIDYFLIALVYRMSRLQGCGKTLSARVRGCIRFFWYIQPYNKKYENVFWCCSVPW